jgi:hypothetical protein
MEETTDIINLMLVKNKREPLTDIEIEELRNAPKQQTHSFFAGIKEIFRDHLRFTLQACLNWFLLGLQGYGILFLAPLYSSGTGDPLIYLLIITAFQIPSVPLISVLVEHPWFGRRLLLMWLNVVTAVCLFIVVFVSTIDILTTIMLGVALCM